MATFRGKAWNNKTSAFEEIPKNVIAFYDEIDAVCKKYNMSISHEDGHGSFEIEKYDEKNLNWLKEANIDL